MEREHRYLHRILFVALTSSLFFGLVLARLYYLQWISHEDFKRQAASQQTKAVKITPQRGSIYSSRGQTLASSEVRETAYMVVSLLRGEPELRRRLAHELSARLGMSLEDVTRKLESPRREVVLARQLPEAKVLELTTLQSELKLPRNLRNLIYFAKEGKRNYPQGQLAAHVIGYTESDDHGDNIGLAGVELSYDEQVRGSYGSERVEKTISLELTPLEDDAFLRATGNDLYLTIDSAIQHYTEAALVRQVEKYEATSASALSWRWVPGRCLRWLPCPLLTWKGAAKCPPGTERTAAWSMPSSRDR